MSPGLRWVSSWTTTSSSSPFAWIDAPEKKEGNPRLLHGRGSERERRARVCNRTASSRLIRRSVINIIILSMYFYYRDLFSSCHILAVCIRSLYGRHIIRKTDALVVFKRTRRKYLLRVAGRFLSVEIVPNTQNSPKKLGHTKSRNHIIKSKSYFLLELRIEFFSVTRSRSLTRRSRKLNSVKKQILNIDMSKNLAISMLPTMENQATPRPHHVFLLGLHD